MEVSRGLEGRQYPRQYLLQARDLERREHQPLCKMGEGCGDEQGMDELSGVCLVNQREYVAWRQAWAADSDMDWIMYRRDTKITSFSSEALQREQCWN